MIIRNTFSKWLLPLLAVMFLSSCDEEGFCIKGKGDVESRMLYLVPIDEIEVNGSTKVYIRQGTQQSIEVKGEPNILDVLNTNVKNGRWTIETTRCVRKHKGIEVYITMASVNHLEVNGSGLIEMRDKFYEGEVYSSVDGSGSISPNIDAQRAISRISGSGSINYAGFGRSHSINISGSGKVRAMDFDSETVTVTISGSGSAEVFPGRTLDVNISGSGSVYYKGEPTVNSKISGSGKVVKR